MLRLLLNFCHIPFPLGNSFLLKVLKYVFIFVTYFNV